MHTWDPVWSFSIRFHPDCVVVLFAALSSLWLWIWLDSGSGLQIPLPHIAPNILCISCCQDCSLPLASILYPLSSILFPHKTFNSVHKRRKQNVFCQWHGNQLKRFARFAGRCPGPGLWERNKDNNTHTPIHPLPPRNEQKKKKKKYKKTKRKILLAGHFSTVGVGRGGNNSIKHAQCTRI